MKWPDEPKGYQVRTGGFKDGSLLYVCPCGQAPNPEMRGITSCMTGIDDMSKACRHIGLVMLFERSIAQQTPDGVQSINSGLATEFGFVDFYSEVDERDAERTAAGVDDTLVEEQ